MKNAKTITRDRRVDLTNRLTLAIDPATAKDFDDAISLKKLDSGDFELSIHIADVSHYVTPGSEADKQARKRATSVYLPNKVIHMLPRKLSEDLCSLRQGEDKLTFSVIFTVDKNGKVLHKTFTKSIIRVDYNLSYQDAQKIIDNDSKLKTEYPADVYRTLVTLMTMSKKIRQRRTDAGAISFETTEVEFEYDNHGRIIGAHAKKHLPTMDMIEDFMLLANEAVANYISDKCRNNTNCIGIYRVHEQPDMEKIYELNNYLRAIGHPLKINKDGTVSPSSINKVLQSVRNTEHEPLVNAALLRTMSKAVYSHKNIGHYSLGFNAYTHFTSPIRRYPDIMVHRILNSLLRGDKLSKKQLVDYIKMAKYSTEMEIEAVKQERDATKKALVRLFEHKEGQEFTGIITGVTEFGLFIAELETRAEGLAHIRNLPGKDYYQLYEKQFALKGKRSKKVFGLGQKVRIRLIGVKPNEGQLDWQVI